jgi:hypothetical protein
MPSNIFRQAGIVSVTALSFLCFKFLFVLHLLECIAPA